MARSLIGGLTARGLDPAAIRVGEPNAGLRQGLAADFGVSTHADNAEAVGGAGVWLLAVKPQVLAAVCRGLAEAAQAHDPLVISIAAGVTSGQIAGWLGGGRRVVRAMPNTPALIGAGMTGLFANPRVDAGQRALAERLLGAVGATAWIPAECLMDAVTAVSGSGPAYFFLLAEALEQAAGEQGLDAATARLLSVQTALGAARMLAESDEPARSLRQRVTSPGGTTQAALESMMADGLPALIARAVDAATRRGRELAAQTERSEPT